YSGYLNFQDHAGDFIRDYMRSGGDADWVLQQLNRLYRDSKRGEA
ncbi:MAG: hypothetical protein K0S39_5300, partial [Paenibacillus sp.]|nr:hypothetical protein [Paenibacillus sp.]